jgi:hypothetical protein
MESLIEKNKDNLLFLSFWSNMSDKDFRRVIKLENQKNNLNDNKFYFKISSNNYSKNFENIEFKVSNRNDFINLNYTDEYWIENKWENLLPTEDGSERGQLYDRIEKQLVEQYSSKYSRIEDYPFSNSYAWRISDSIDRIIIMHIYKNVWTIPDNNSPITFGPHKDENNNQIRLAKCEIDLNYSLYKDYLEGIEERKMEMKEFQEREELEKKKAEENNDNL